VEGAQLTLLATGSEVHLAIAAQALLVSKGIRTRVVSAPCMDAFEEAPQQVRDQVLPPSLPVVTIEAGVTGLWRSVTGPRGLSIGIDTFGRSAPDTVLAEKFGFQSEIVCEKVVAWMQQNVQRLS
jgi:transketolase